MTLYFGVEGFDNCSRNSGGFVMNLGVEANKMVGSYRKYRSAVWCDGVKDQGATVIGAFGAQPSVNCASKWRDVS